MSYSPSKPPSVSSPDAQALAAYLTDELQVLASSLRSVDSVVYSVSNAAPIRPRVGTVVYADGTNWNPGAGEGLYVYNAAGNWIWIDTPTLPISVANGGTGDTGTAWSTYTPTLTAGTGSFTSASAAGRYKQLGKTVFCHVTITVTTVGTGLNPKFNVPITPLDYNKVTFIGTERATKGVVVSGAGLASISLVFVADYGNGNTELANGSIIELFSVYEAA